MFNRMGIGLAAIFCRRVGTGFRAGLDIVSLFEREAKHGSQRHRDVMEKISQELRQGQPLARAMLDSGKYFPPLLVQMVHVGEQSGRLERTLLEVADHYDHRVLMRRTFLRGIAWPLIQLVGGILVVGLAILIAEMLGSVNPIGISLQSYILIVISGVCIITGLSLAVVYNAFGIHRLFSLVYQIPKIGESLQTIALSRICWTLSLTLDSGLDAMRSVKMALQSTQNDYFASRSDQAIERIKSGGTLADAFKCTGIFPEEFLHFIEVAELSGTDAESLGNLANIYDDRAKLAMRVLVGMMTGLIWLSVVGFLVFLIIRIAMGIGSMYNEALAPI